MMGFAGQLSLGHALYVGLGGYTAAALYVHFGIGPWIGLLAAIAWRRPAARSSAFSRSASASAASISPSSPSPSPNSRASASIISAGSAARAGCSCRSRITRSNDLWNLRGKPIMFYYVILALTVAALSCCAMRCCAAASAITGRRSARTRQAARALGIDTFRYKMYRGRDLRRHDLGRRRVLRLLLQQPVSRAGVQHRALDRDHPRPDHRRRRHAVRPDRRRLPAHRPCRDHVRNSCARSASTRPAPSRCSTAWCCWSSSSCCPDGVWPWLARGSSAWRSRDHERAPVDRWGQQALPRPARGRQRRAFECRKARSSR